MSCFVDTSALLALLDADQPRHHEVAESWERIVSGEDLLLTSNYVLVETCALVQRRLGIGALRAFVGVMVPLLHPVWIDQELHEAALGALFAADRRSLSLVDCTSFELMRRRGIERALALDVDFARQGFVMLPPPSGEEG